MANLQVTVNPEWTDYVTQEVDIFLTTYCGYWMRGMENDPALGWLVFEHGEEMSPNKTPPKVMAAWREGGPLPEKWYRIDKAAAEKAWLEGVKRSGQDWYENGDAVAYDCALQMALLGEIRYG